MSFPPSPSPSYYTGVTVGAPHGVFYAGGAAPTMTLSKSGATTYVVRDRTGAVVSTGSVSSLTVTPTAPTGGWVTGWYRIYFTGASTDSIFGPAYASSCFNVMRSTTRFPAFTTGGEDSNLNNLPVKASAGMGTSRIEIDHANAYTTGLQTLAVAQTAAALSATLWNVTSGPLLDTGRTRLPWLAFPNGTADFINLGALNIYCKTGAIDGSTVTVTATSGTSSGTKITVNTETYDNLANCSAAAAALVASALVIGFVTGGNGANTVPTAAAAAIGNTYFNGVKTCVTTLYPSITRFEGPSNEPNLNIECVQQMMLFRAAVKAGNASALAIGPCPVNIGGIGSQWDTFLAAGGGAYCDEISFHAYNAQTNGDINLGRSQIGAFKALLASYGYASKPLWQTESTQVMSSVYGIYHPRRARVPLLETLLWEQYGVPRERNSFWYDISHGFWDFPSWVIMGDDSLNPMAVLYRTLSEETFGQAHSSVMSFGTIGDRLFLGSIYTGSTGSTAVIQMTSYLPGSTVTLTVTGTTSPLTVVDGQGNSSTVTIANGRAVIPVAEIPTYVRLPTGVSVAVYSCRDWPPVANGAWVNTAHGYPITVSGTVTPISVVTDGGWQQLYGSAGSGSGYGTTMPDTLTITYATAARIDRALIWSGIVWQGESSLLDFDVQTSIDGTTWVTQATYTNPIVAGTSSFVFGSDSLGVGCTRETYWDEQYVFDLPFPAPVTCKAVRLNVRATSYGGEPDAASVTVGGQGNAAQYITSQEWAVFCDDNAARPHFATLR